MSINKIKHIVLSGGGPTGYKYLGALQHLEEKGFYNINNIESIYCTSIGSIIGSMLCLKYDWETLNNYVINRPWKDAFPITTKQVLEAYSNKGLYDKRIADIIFKPLLEAKDLSLKTTLKELYDYSNIELHIYTVEINSFSLVDLSYKTHPDLLLTNAVFMSSTIPTLLAPICDENNCYIDGGLLCNYPILNCLNTCKEENVLGIRGDWSNKSPNNVINKDSNLLEFGTGIFINMIHHLITSNINSNINSITNEVLCKAEHMSLATINEIIEKADVRKQFLEDGKIYAQELLDKLEKQDKLEKENIEDNT
jgi:predicted acylesterase/phospholipase RssA